MKGGGVGKGAGGAKKSPGEKKQGVGWGSCEAALSRALRTSCQCYVISEVAGFGCRTPCDNCGLGCCINRASRRDGLVRLNRSGATSKWSGHAEKAKNLSTGKRMGERGKKSGGP